MPSLQDANGSVNAGQHKHNEGLPEVFCNPSSVPSASLKCRLIHATVLRSYNQDKWSDF